MCYFCNNIIAWLRYCTHALICFAVSKLLLHSPRQLTYNISLDFEASNVSNLQTASQIAAIASNNPCLSWLWNFAVYENNFWQRRECHNEGRPWVWAFRNVNLSASYVRNSYTEELITAGRNRKILRSVYGVHIIPTVGCAKDYCLYRNTAISALIVRYNLPQSIIAIIVIVSLTEIRGRWVNGPRLM